MAFMDLTLDVSKVTGWLNADAPCRVERRPCDAGRGAGGVKCGRACGAGAAQAVCRVGPSEGWGQRKGERGAHPEHIAHVRDAGRVPAGDVLVEVLQVVEEAPHVGDGRDVPVGDGAALRRVSVVRLERRLQGCLGCEGG
eukprot:scaffold6966_cov30-Phaeocystis_antarctica.AAC.1